MKCVTTYCIHPVCHSPGLWVPSCPDLRQGVTSVDAVGASHPLRRTRTNLEPLFRHRWATQAPSVCMRTSLVLLPFTTRGQTTRNRHLEEASGATAAIWLRAWPFTNRRVFGPNQKTTVCPHTVCPWAPLSTSKSRVLTLEIPRWSSAASHSSTSGTHLSSSQFPLPEGWTGQGVSAIT